MHDPLRTKLLTHEKGIKLSANMAKVYKNQEEHDPRDIHRAREVASEHDPIPVGILYRNDEIPCYEELRNAGQQRSTRYIKQGFESELDKFTVWPEGGQTKPEPKTSVSA